MKTPFGIALAVLSGLLATIGIVVLYCGFSAERSWDSPKADAEAIIQSASLSGHGMNSDEQSSVRTIGEVQSQMKEKDGMNTVTLGAICLIPLALLGIYAFFLHVDKPTNSTTATPYP